MIFTTKAEYGVRLLVELGKQDAGAWLVSNGWARAAPSGPYAQAEAEAREAGRGIFGPPPTALPVDAGAADHIEAATLPADPTVPVE